MYFADFIEKYMHMYFSIKSAKYTKNTKKYYVIYLLIVAVIKYSLLHARWRKPEVEVIQNRQLYMNSI